MEFGKVDNPGLINFSLPSNHPETERVLKNGKKNLEVYYLLILLKSLIGS